MEASKAGYYLGDRAISLAKGEVRSVDVTLKKDQGSVVEKVATWSICTGRCFYELGKMDFFMLISSSFIACRAAPSIYTCGTFAATIGLPALYCGSIECLLELIM